MSPEAIFIALIAALPGLLALLVQRRNRAADANKTDAEAADELAEASTRFVDLSERIREQAERIWMQRAVDWADRVERLESKIADLEDLRLQAMKDSAERDCRIGELEKALADERINNQAMRRELTEAQAQIGRMTARINQLVEEKRTLEDRLAKYEQKGGDCGD